MDNESLYRGYLLDLAIGKDDIEEAKHLIGSGAKISTTAMLLAINKNNTDMAKLLLENNTPVTDISLWNAYRDNKYIFKLIYYNNIPIVKVASSIIVKYTE